MSGLFIKQDFTSHSGLPLHWKIECDALDWDDWVALAQMASEVLPPFRQAIGIPRGGLAFARALAQYQTNDEADPILIVDDVLTTGNSMLDFRGTIMPEDDSFNSIGVVAFSRTPVEQLDATVSLNWITPVFQIASPRSE